MSRAGSRGTSRTPRRSAVEEPIDVDDVEEVDSDEEEADEEYEVEAIVDSRQTVSVEDGSPMMGVG